MFAFVALTWLTLFDCLFGCCYLQTALALQIDLPDRRPSDYCWVYWLVFARLL